MKKKILLMVIIFLSFFISTETIFASATFGFGGKVLTNTIPSNIKCTESGTFITLSSNIGGAVSATSSATSSGNSTGQKVSGTVTGIYKMIPFYATNLSKKPRKDGWILGKADSVPNMSICKMKIGNTSIPIPVRKTASYNISGGIPNPSEIAPTTPREATFDD